MGANLQAAGVFPAWSQTSEPGLLSSSRGLLSQSLAKLCSSVSLSGSHSRASPGVLPRSLSF